jgi:membrane fusion protein, multidrug efflux system
MPETERQPPLPGKTPRRPFVVVLIAVLAVAALVFGVSVWLHARDYESTDDAFVDGPVIPISPKVAGRVVEVRIHENQEVKQGELLVKVDPRDYEIAVEQRQAALDVAHARRESAQTSVAQAAAHIKTFSVAGASIVAEVAAAEAEALKSRQDLVRTELLEKHGVLSTQDLQHSSATNDSDAAKLESSHKQAETAQAYLDEVELQKTIAELQFKASEAEVRAAEADLAQAKLQLSYVEIRAPQDGRVTKKAVESGAYVQVAQTLFSLVPRDLWVTGNFKETQLRDMRPGQPVAIAIDAYSRTVRGHVDSIMAGSGARFSLLPPENATGNFVKVVQRVPVKILFEQIPENLIGPGMSVVPDVQVRSSTGATVILALTALLAIVIAAVVVRRALRV